MAGGLIKVDTKQLDAFSKKLKDATNDDVQAFFEKCSKELAIRLLRRTIQKTPKDLGNLQRGWTAKPGTPPTREYKPRTTPEQWAESALIKRTGKQYEITISNPIEYAVYVEYGHRTRGRHHPENPHKTTETSGWVPGYFMLTLSVEEIESMKVGILQKLLLDFLNGLFR